MRSIALAVALSLALVPAGAFAKAPPQCKTGVVCGDTCIAKGKVCHVTPAPKQCNKGKPCGNTCIAKDKICHKPG